MADAGKTISAVFWLVMILIWIATSVAKAKRGAAARPQQREWPVEPGPASRPAPQPGNEVVFEAPTEDVAAFLREVAEEQQEPSEPQPYFAPPPLPVAVQPAEPEPYFVEAPEPAPPKRPPRRAAPAVRVETKPAPRISVAGQFGTEDMRRNMVLIEVLGRPRALRQWGESSSWDPVP